MKETRQMSEIEVYNISSLCLDVSKSLINSEAIERAPRHLFVLHEILAAQDGISILLQGQ